MRRQMGLRLGVALLVSAVVVAGAVLLGGRPMRATASTAANLSGPYEALVGEDVEFDASSSTGSGLTFSWKLGEGAGPFVTGGATWKHTFQEKGIYEVTVRVADAEGNQDTATATITVRSCAGCDPELPTFVPPN